MAPAKRLVEQPVKSAGQSSRPHSLRHTCKLVPKAGGHTNSGPMRQGVRGNTQPAPSSRSPACALSSSTCNVASSCCATPEIRDHQTNDEATPAVRVHYTNEVSPEIRVHYTNEATPEIRVHYTHEATPHIGVYYTNDATPDIDRYRPGSPRQYRAQPSATTSGPVICSMLTCVGHVVSMLMWRQASMLLCLCFCMLLSMLLCRPPAAVRPRRSSACLGVASLPPTALPIRRAADASSLAQSERSRIAAAGV